MFEARHRELEIRAASERLTNRVSSAITRDEIATIASELAQLQEQAATLLVKSETGVFSCCRKHSASWAVIFARGTDRICDKWG